MELQDANTGRTNMENHELVLNDMRSLCKTCRDMEMYIRGFGKKRDSTTALIDEIGLQLSNLGKEREEKSGYVATNGFDEEGDFSYAKLGYAVSLAYKRYSEILNEFRFGLDRLKLLDEYKKYEIYAEPGGF